MDLIDRISRQFENSARIRLDALEGLAAPIAGAIAAAREREMHVIALTGPQPEAIEALLGGGDISIRLAAHRPARVLELQLLVLHCLCDGIDCLLLGVED